VIRGAFDHIVWTFSIVVAGFAIGLAIVCALAFLVVAGCYDASKLPPCSPGASWPDPCYVPTGDAGAK
jgi:hypothetical protein